MLRGEHLLADGQGAFDQRLGLGIATLQPVEIRKVTQMGGDIGMTRAKRLLADGDGALGQRLGLGIAALLPVEACEISETTGHIGMVGGQQFFSDAQSFGERALCKRIDACVICRHAAGG